MNSIEDLRKSPGVSAVSIISVRDGKWSVRVTVKSGQNDIADGTLAVVEIHQRRLEDAVTMAQRSINDLAGWLS